MLACDFLTVETIFLQRIYVLFFISLATRRIEYPDGRWVTQQARNLAMQLGDEHPVRFLIHDRDTKFSHAFDEVFRTEGIKIIRTPVQAPNANAFAERWVRTVRADCLPANAAGSQLKAMSNCGDMASPESNTRGVRITKTLV